MQDLFSKYELSHYEQWLLVKNVNFCLPPRYLHWADYLINFELFFTTVFDIGIFSNGSLNFLKARTKEVAHSCYRIYNNNVLQPLCKEEFCVLQSLSKNKNIVIQNSHKGIPVAIADKARFLDKMDSRINGTWNLKKRQSEEWWNFVFCC